jgi:hypothetical protein
VAVVTADTPLRVVGIARDGLGSDDVASLTVFPDSLPSSLVATILDEEGAPIEGVVIGGLCGEPQLTDERGFLSFTNVALGKGLVLTASHPDYMPTTVHLTREEGEMTAMLGASEVIVFDPAEGQIVETLDGLVTLSYDGQSLEAEAGEVFQGTSRACVRRISEQAVWLTTSRGTLSEDGTVRRAPQQAGAWLGLYDDATDAPPRFCGEGDALARPVPPPTS